MRPMRTAGWLVTRVLPSSERNQTLTGVRSRETKIPIFQRRSERISNRIGVFLFRPIREPASAFAYFCPQISWVRNLQKRLLSTEEADLFPRLTSVELLLVENEPTSGA